VPTASKPSALRVARLFTARAAEGDCYEAAANYIVERGLGLWGGKGKPKSGLILVHGEVAGQGPLEGVNFGHAWVLDGNTVIDNSNGRNLRMPKSAYYALGKIDEINNFHEYDVETARHMLLRFKTYGPWDLETSTGL